MHDGNEEEEPHIILLDRGSAELLPKQEHIKMERTLPTGTTVEGGMTCNFAVGQQSGRMSGVWFLARALRISLFVTVYWMLLESIHPPNEC